MNVLHYVHQLVAVSGLFSAEQVVDSGLELFSLKQLPAATQKQGYKSCDNEPKQYSYRPES